MTCEMLRVSHVSNARFFFPINLNNQHWAAGVVDLKTKTITIYDSSSAKEKHATRREKLLQVLCCLRHTSYVILAPSTLNMKLPR